MSFPDKKLLAALAVSLALHLGLLSAPPLAMPEAPAPRVVEARLLRSETPPLPPPAKPQRKARPRAVPPPAMPVAPERSPAVAPPPPAAMPEAIPPPPLVEPVAATPPSSPSPPPPPAASTLPAHAWLRFDVIKGELGLVVGRATHVWQRDGERYSLTSLAEATGPFSWFISGQHKQESHGRIDAAGLRPDSYSAQRGKAEKTDAARFDWESMTLQLASEGKESYAKLVPGVRDMLSFVYQFAFSLPERGDIPVDLTNGRKLDSYRYRIVAEEDLETPLGVVKALHLMKLHDPGEEGTEIWLGMDYHYFPVKIRQTDKQGDRFEQVIAEIRYE